MIALHTSELADRIFIADGSCAEALAYLADGAGLHSNERLMMLIMLDALNIFSGATMRHSLRVGLQVRTFCTILGHTARDAARFGLYACLHDAGKMSVPITMLEKPGKFTAEERDLVETHVKQEFLFPEQFSRCHRDPFRHALRFHHENFDGTGYPDRLAGNQIPEIAQITRLCDFFDAVRQDRPYRKGLSLPKTIALMQQSQGAFNPKLFKVFRNEIGSIDRCHLRALH
ncbi:MAG: hypothetical protein CMN56_02060 [Sneathiella sp.]|uniref:HD-GYP domain-containing protein n=1 Tax=Sneathiella sp. TaxID=1964365 RepID=UPI000C4D4131|nr:HD domain-containing phosphohydrolase [Sneathiella sp.]MAZ01900.1 hypothetical protein [Sneathiella sp.]